MCYNISSFFILFYFCFYFFHHLPKRTFENVSSLKTTVNALTSLPGKQRQQQKMSPPFSFLLFKIFIGVIRKRKRKKKIEFYFLFRDVSI